MRNHADLLSSLAADIGSAAEGITSDCTIEVARKISLSRSLLKKWLPKDTAKADALALEKFIACNDACRSFELRPAHLYDDEIIGEVKSFLDNCFFEGPYLTLDLRAIARGFGVGPGASVKAKDTSWYTKMWSSSLSTTDQYLYDLYRLAISPYSTWVEADLERQSHFGCETVQGSKLSFVPKTFEISRTICTEPLLNMIFQKGIGRALERILKRRVGIDLATQPDINRTMARIGSIDGSFGTIDLTNASDSISLTLVRELFPPYVVRWLELTSCRRTVLPDGSTVELSMVSSMGNAFTFPLQTLLFSAIVTAVYRVLGIKPTRCNSKLPNFAVFGDDIIVRRDAYDLVVRSLGLFGFKVNGDKSFNSGDFRESCGHDYFRGYNVRGIYLKRLDIAPDVYSAFNRLARWSSCNGIPLTNLLAHLYERLPYEYRICVPYVESDDSGLKVTLETARVLYSVARPHVQPRGRLKRYWVLGPGKLYACLAPVPRRVSIGSDASRFMNPLGAIISSAEGFVRQLSYSLRSDSREYKVCVVRTPFWFAREATAWDPSLKRTCLDSLAVTRNLQEDGWEADFALRLTTVEARA